jgi:hypothetical protein
MIRRMSPETSVRAEPWSGKCVLLYAYDIAQGIDLERAAGLLRTQAEREKLRHRVHAPAYFQFQPAPVHVDEEAFVYTLGRWAVSAHVELILYDFGAVSVSYTITFSGPLEEWIEFGCALQETQALSDDALERMRGLTASIQPAIQKFSLAEVSEDYVLFQFPALDELEETLESRASEIARLLRAERSALSQQEVSDALTMRVSFTPRDALLVDWNAAVMFDDVPDDVSAVLEFANVQLLEMRFLDRQLDLDLERAFETLGKRHWASLFRPAALERDLGRISRLQVDAAILFERVGNTLKLVSDQYLARAYRQSSKRFRLGEWNASILRKLDTLDGIYQKIHDRAEARRMEFLEWLIILLCLIPLLLPFVPGYPGHP